MGASALPLRDKSDFAYQQRSGSIAFQHVPIKARTERQSCHGGTEVESFDGRGGDARRGSSDGRPPLNSMIRSTGSSPPISRVPGIA
ncbi:hypothetical protein J6590_103214 [Homalodisca vitripennis]|nr:hypothetical protein J6590_103214 [Homalodisca vitripennis]